MDKNGSLTEKSGLKAFFFLSEHIKSISLLLFSCSVVCYYLWLQRLHQARLPCSSPYPGACSNSCPLSQWCHPTISSSAIPFSPCLQSSQHQSLSNESVPRIRWPKYWSFSLSIIPYIEYSGLISFRIDLFDLLAVQGTLKSLLQHHSLKASIISRALRLQIFGLWLIFFFQFNSPPQFLITQERKWLQN